YYLLCPSLPIYPSQQLRDTTDNSESDRWLPGRLPPAPEERVGLVGPFGNQVQSDMVPAFSRSQKLITVKALVGFQGLGFADRVQPDFCHSLLLEALIFQ